jgi:hypothetical protein
MIAHLERRLPFPVTVRLVRAALPALRALIQTKETGR